MIVHNLKILGIKAKAGKDRIVIQGSPVGIGKIKTHHDHRMAMAFTLLGAKVDDKRCVTKSYPSFWTDWKKIQQHSKQQTIVLLGMRGAGKTTLGKKLAKQYTAKFVDTDEYTIAEVGTSYRKYPLAITEIVAKHGWSHFRKIESAAIKKISTQTNAILALGGGALLAKKNCAILQGHYRILLVVPIAELRRRLAQHGQTKHRPSLTSSSLSSASLLAELPIVWQQRRARYYANADQIITPSVTHRHHAR